MSLPDHFGHTIFCDDIRREVGGKITFVGAYTNTIFLHGDFPFTLPKFGIGITYFQRREAFSGETILFQVTLPSDKNVPATIDMEIPIAEARVQGQVEVDKHASGEEALPDGWPLSQFLRIDQQIIASPLVLTRTGVIKVRAIADTKIAKIGILRVGRKPIESPAS